MLFLLSACLQADMKNGKMRVCTFTISMHSCHVIKKKEFPMGHRFKCEDISFAFMLMVSSVLIMMGLLG